MVKLPRRLFCYVFSQMCPPVFQIMSKNASQLETHYQPVLGAEIMLHRRLIVIIDGRKYGFTNYFLPLLSKT